MMQHGDGKAADYESVSAHAVFLSEDLVHQQLLRWLDAGAKAALRLVCKGIRSLVDGAVQVVSTPSSGASANDLASALLRWPALRDLTLLNVSDSTDLSPLTTASLAGLTSLTGACSEKLEELWVARSFNVVNLAPLAACTKLRKLDLRECSSSVTNQVEGLQLMCTKLADPATVKLEGMVHELLPNMPPDAQMASAAQLWSLASSGAQQAAIAAAGGILALVRLLGPDSTTGVQRAAAWALSSLADNHADNRAAITSAGAVPVLEQLLESPEVRAATAGALRNLV
ncbi:hypothetical protein FOA52_011121 [Chlamydomonas sp. UWO 241]|nr:hypothetical protein FOA52_011121 [Chlamydomonas sp. UWO 241]